MATLDIERARELNRAMLALKMTGEVRECLESASLADLQACADIIRAADKANDTGTTRRISMVCDDRLVAGIYTLLHFDASEPDDEVESVVQCRGKALYVLQPGASYGDDDADDDA